MSTVSKVLNGRSGVSEPTRKRVEKLLQSQGYSRRGTGTTASSLIEIVFESFDVGWATELLIGVERIARQNGMSVVLTECGSRHALDAEWMAGLLKRQPAALILVFSDLTHDHKRQLKLRNIPFVVIDPAGDPGPDVPSVGSANWSGGFAATKHLIGLGHTDIAMISGPNDLMCSVARVSGYQSALQAAGLEFDQGRVLQGNFGRAAGIELGTRLLTAKRPPTAIFAGNDMQALGVYEAARMLGLSVPDDVSVVGYDDLQVASWVSPPLTTIRQPLTEMAEEATRLVLRLRTDPQTPHLRIDLATSLVERGSTAHAH